MYKRLLSPTSTLFDEVLHRNDVSKSESEKEAEEEATRASIHAENYLRSREGSSFVQQRKRTVREKILIKIIIKAKSEHS